ncbi:MAG: hypothetical protein SH850_28710 [Planctomycetaceae bacterium]|nr:hypothetical protein [Planctomycetaceae bacterium]
MMQAILVRVGVDHSYGQWNAPVDPRTGAFEYVPIPEKSTTLFYENCAKPYSLIEPRLRTFAARNGLDLFQDLRCSAELLQQNMHLDPDFDHLTYGDDGDRRGSHIRQLQRDDMLVFYSGLRPIVPCEHRLIYAIIGLFRVAEVVDASKIPSDRWGENAHTRKIKRGLSDIVVRAQPRGSGLLQRCLKIGEMRDKAYRVTPSLLSAWGGLSVNDGYIQRSARPPRFLDAGKFANWFEAQAPEFTHGHLHG